MARVQAEADVQDRERRLSVAQIQLAEYATQKESDASGLLGDAEELQRQLAALLAGSDGEEGAPAQLRERAEQLCAKMGEYVRESKAFAEQQRSDLENAKRSSDQVWQPHQRGIPKYFISFCFYITHLPCEIKEHHRRVEWVHGWD
jgi:hypothetical protein